MIENQLQYLGIAILLGLSSGLSPGPLLTLVITQTIKHNRKEGIKVAISPLFTDLPIVLLSIYIFKELANFDAIIALISFLGGVFIAYLGIDSFRTKELQFNAESNASDSIKKGIIANILNPHPYIFWITVNAPMVYKTYQISLLLSILYISLFYFCLIGSKVLIAHIASKTKKLLNLALYQLIMKILGILLLVFSALFFYEAIKFVLL